MRTEEQYDEFEKRLKEIEHELGMSRREILRISAKEVLDKYTST